MTNHENDISTTIENNTENELAQVNKNISEADNVNSLTPTPSEANELNPLAEPVATGQKNIISVDEASSVSSGNNIYINQNNKLMQIDYDTLATAILNKLSTQSFNSLNTSSKLVLDAINELNSNAMKNTYASALVKGSSWNNVTPGTYWFNLYTGSGGSGYPTIDDMGIALYFKGASDSGRMIAVGAKCIQIGVKTDGGDFVWNHIDYQ